MKLTTEYLYKVTSKHDNADDAAAALLNIVNTHIAALETQRDELKRRLDAVMKAIKEDADNACYCEFDSQQKRTPHCEYCESFERAKAIAEGRTP